MTPGTSGLASWPNLITLFRIATIPAILALVHADTPTSCFVGAALFTVATFSDLVDGYLARRLGQVSALGKLVDPLADKLLIMACLILLVDMDRLAAWIAMVIVGRELAVTTLRGVATTQGLVIAASESGKQKTLLQNIGTGLLLLHYDYVEINAHDIGTIFIWIALVYTVWSGADYFRLYLKAALGDRPS
ncbi:MAG: CDP-diacylglycerol--glycerol-3-phosphate 3-phosphatidyltransferase [Nitrospirae bacterium]|nr:CDP-diacylglycerol--glycerol-3-phosphate 3-phosphatidyltransferase [Nitrospirota bacterium]